jgi:hypothetical protein
MTIVRIALATVLTAFGVATTPLLAQAPAPSATASPTDAQIRELQQQVQSLQRQLDEIKAAPNAATRQGLVQRNWHDMQNYLGQMHDRWGMGYPWMTGRPWSMSGPGMMGEGRSWPVPPGLTPEQYDERMRSHVKRMQEQMARIAQATDPQERQRLMQEHWQGMYQEMQTLRGMGWMWGGGPMTGPGMEPGMMGGGMMNRPAPSDPLPDAASSGAKLASTYCSQCHAAPQPSLHTAKEWISVTQRMHDRMLNSWKGIKTPTDTEMKAIVDYMQKHARQ